MKYTIPVWLIAAAVGILIVVALIIDGLGTVFWLVTLGGLDALAVYYIMKIGLAHGDPIPEKPDDSVAVRTLRQENAERLARIEAARARAALPAGEAEPS